MADQSANSGSYVRTQMLSEQAPPLKEVGMVKWVRENLFSSPLNIILTLISLFVVYLALSTFLPWALRGVWVADSLDGCREVLAAQGLTSHDGACWAVITERWNQLLFGFYPQHLYWRPVLALLMFLVGLAPILFVGLPRTLVIFSVVAPFACFWLIWGGSVWMPITILLGFVIGYFAAIKLPEIIGGLGANIAAILLPIIYWFLIAGPLANGLHAIIPIGIEAVESRNIGGFLLSTTIGLAAIVLSLPIGIGLALARQSDLPLIKYSGVAFIEVIRGIPLIVWLFTAQLLLNYFLPPGTSFDLTLRVIIMVTLFSSAYIAEVIRGGLAALPKGQYEGADSLGLNYAQSMQLIVLPQALKISIPGIVNTFIGLYKDTTLVVFIGLLDPLGVAQGIRSNAEWNGIYWEIFVFIGVLFFIACFSMGRYSLYLEKKLQREHR